jgi:hypothetical protein
VATAIHPLVITRLSIAAIACLVLAVVIDAGARRVSGGTVAIDLLELLDRARRQPSAEGFRIEPRTRDGEQTTAILAPAVSRLTFYVTVPDRSMLRVRLAAEGADAGHGVRFSIGVSDGRAFRQMFERTLERLDEDRGWVDASIDLREYAGLTVELIFNTRAIGAPAEPRPAVALWGSPAVVVW